MTMANMTNVMTCDTAIPADRIRAIKARQQSMWASGDFAVIGATLQIVGELLNEAADVRALHRVLDVAAGSGNATLAAARRFASVTSTDYVPALLERARRRADAEGFANLTFEVADAEALPYPDASFDVVLSTFGVMFAPDHQRAAAELMRVCRPGGRIMFLNHSRSTNPVVSAVERLITPLTVHAGFRADFDLGAMLAQSGLNAVAVERVNIPRLWRLVTCVK